MPPTSRRSLREHPSTAPRRTRRTRIGALLLVLGVTAASCTSGGEGSDGSDAAAAVPAADSVQRYVALGDSFTAAPFVPNVIEAEGCYRSTSNYPSVVARSLPNAEFVDASCSGADTTHMTRPQETMAGGKVAPQFEALTEDTDLVTVGIGGNDFNVFYQVVSRCPEVARSAPNGAPCRRAMRTADGDKIEQSVARTGNRVARLLSEIKERSPQARVLLVTYPQIAPSSGTCAELPLARGDYAYTAQVGEWLDEALKGAAQQAGAELVDAFAASEGHDVCSAEPWVNGRDTDFSRAMSYHPFEEGQAAVARLVLDTVG